MISNIKIKPIGVYPEFKTPRPVDCEGSEISGLIEVQHFYLPVWWYVDPAPPRSYLRELTASDFEVSTDQTGVNAVIEDVLDRTAPGALDRTSQSHEDPRLTPASGYPLVKYLLVRISGDGTTLANLTITANPTSNCMRNALPVVTADTRPQPQTAIGTAGDPRVASQSGTTSPPILIRPKLPGFEPTLGNALSVESGNAELQRNPVVEEFIVPVTWTADGAAEAVSDFQKDDISITTSDFTSTPTVTVESVARAGSTNTWHVRISAVPCPGAQAQSGTITVQVKAGAIEAKTNRYESLQSAPMEYRIGLKEPGPVFMFNNDYLYEPNGGILSITGQWSFDTRGIFANDSNFDTPPFDNRKISITTDRSGVTARNILITQIPVAANGRLGRDYQITANLVNASDDDANNCVTVTIAVPDALVDETATRFAGRGDSIMIIRPAITLPTIGEISRQGAELPSPLQLKHGDEIVVPIRFPSTRQITTFPQCRLSVCISMESGNVAHDIESLTRVVGGDNEWEATVRILRFGNYAGSGTLTVILNSSHADLGFVSDVTRSWAIDVQSRRRAPRFSNFSLAGQIFSFNVLWHENVGSAFSNADISISSSNTAVQVSDIAVTPNPNNRERDFIVTSRVIGFGEVTFTARIPAGAIPENEPAGTFYEATVEYTESYCSSGNRPFATLGTALDTARGIIQTNDGDTEATAIRGRNQFIVPMSWSPTEDLGLRVSEFDINDIRIIAEPIDLEVRLTATNSHVARPEDAPKTTLIIRITQS